MPYQTVFELSAAAGESWQSALSNVENLLMAFGPEQAEIEVVVHGPAIGLLRQESGWAYVKGPCWEGELEGREMGGADALASAVRRIRAGAPPGGMIQVSFHFDERAPLGNRVRECFVAGEPLSTERIYRVATNSLPASGGHNYRAFSTGTDTRELGAQFEMPRAAMVRKWCEARLRASLP